jgi:nitroimidazol reductase NimA-like FMN-containing flavoprotein (pyridoxamine 5'-phosphate oxidase superfamily)
MADMRRQDRKLSEEDARRILEEGEYGVLSMCSPGEGGYGVPVNYVFGNGAVYIHCATEGTKLTCIAANNLVSFCVVGKIRVMPESFGTLYESAIVSGRAEETTGEEKREALVLFIRKYSPSHFEEGMRYIEKMYDRAKVIRISPATITAKGRKK